MSSLVVGTLFCHPDSPQYPDNVCPVIHTIVGTGVDGSKLNGNAGAVGRTGSTKRAVGSNAER